jgi:hypothetical protein
MEGKMLVEADIVSATFQSVGKTLIPLKKDSKGRSIPFTEDRLNTEYRQDGVRITMTLELYLSNSEMEKVDPKAFQSPIEVSLSCRAKE